MHITQFAFEAIGTSWSIDLYGQYSTDEQKKLLTEIENRIDTFDKTYSRFRSDSLITKMSREAGEYVFPSDARELFSFYKRLYQITEGKVTPLIGNVLSEAGYDASYSLKPKVLQSPERWENVIEESNSKVVMKKPAILDFGAAGKGYIIDIIGEMLRKHAINAFCIDAGGDILYKNPKNKELRVGLENPDNTNQVIGVSMISNESICGSAGNRRKWGSFHHIIDPFTLQSPTNIKALWVIAKTAILADGLSTCLYFTSPEKLRNYFDFEYLILRNDYSIEKSKNFPGELFIKN